jgi:predicted DNA-binding transcriptional regulator AlpA
VTAVRHLPVSPAQQGRKPAGSRDKLTVAEVCDELQIAQSTFYEWRTKGTGPRCIKMPNGQLRIRRTALDAWCDAREEAA